MEKIINATDKTKYIRSIVTDLLLTIISCGLFNLWVQHKQMETVNFMLKKENYHFLPWLLLTFVTCGMYHVYHEYRMTQDICLALDRRDSNEPLVNLVLSLFVLSFIADALQQALINEYFGEDGL